MFRKGFEEPQEVLFAADVPLSMVKKILSEKNLVFNINDDEDDSKDEL